MAKRKIYRFKGTEGSSMEEKVVKKWIQQHEDHHATKAHFFGKEIIHKILGQPGCMGIRTYHAIDDQGKKQMILVGADEKGNNMWPSTSPKAKGKKSGDEEENIVADQSTPCPPNCPPSTNDN